MSHIFRSIITFVFHLGYFGPLVLGIADSSFLVMPFGNDLLVVALVAHHANRLAVYVISAAIGSTLGVLLVDIVARRVGEEGISKLAGPKRYKRLKDQMGKRAPFAIMLAALAPPPFPFTMFVGTASALNYPRLKLLGFTALARTLRFTIVALLAVKFGNEIIRITKTSAFEWSMGIFITFSILATAFSIWKWLGQGRGR